MRLIDADPLCRKLREEMNEREKHLFGNDYNHDYMCGEQDECDRIYDAIDEAPTIDAVPIADVEAWLLEIAFNCVGVQDDMSACAEEIANRMDGLRRFSKDRRKTHERKERA